MSEDVNPAFQLSCFSFDHWLIKTTLKQSWTSLGYSLRLISLRCVGLAAVGEAGVTSLSYSSLTSCFAMRLLQVLLTSNMCCSVPRCPRGAQVNPGYDTRAFPPFRPSCWRQLWADVGDRSFLMLVFKLVSAAAAESVDPKHNVGTLPPLPWNCPPLPSGSDLQSSGWRKTRHMAESAVHGPSPRTPG